MKRFLFITNLLLFAATAFAQINSRITGKVLQNDKPASGATVSLLNAKDSAIQKLSVANKEGVFSFENIDAGKYLVSVTAVGHQKSFSKIFELNNAQLTVNLPSIALAPESKSMTDIVITAKRPLIEQKIDRTIVNVDASITNVGTSALEVLEKSPGVTVDNDGNISLKGKEGVMIMVDGRPTQLSGPDLTNLLRNMNSSQLDQIEIMTNPPARYDAAGNAGIINIKTKKIITAGLNGSVSVSYGQGKYPKANEGFNFNYRNSKVNLFTNLSHNFQKRYSVLAIDRNILNSNNTGIDQIFNQEANRVNTGNSYSGKFGVDFFTSKKTTIGAVVNLNTNSSVSNNPNITRISNASKELESITNARVKNESEWRSINTNLNFRHTLDQKGREITSDIDFVKHATDNSVFMVNSYSDANGNMYNKSDSLMGDLPQRIDVYSARVDYFHPIKKDARFEAGIKSSIVRTDNNALYDSIQNGNIIHDYNRSNHFIYEENINAAYVNLSTPLSKKISAQFGLRLENTNAKGRQKTTGQNFDRHYVQLFPTAYLQYKADDNNTIGANFGRRIRRPGYGNLNPFIRFIDRYTYSQGNPNLKPALSNNFELSHTWKNRITTTLNYTHTKDILQEVIQQKGNEAYNTPDNVASLDQFGIAVNANTTITKWWNSNINLNVSNNNYKGVINNDPVNQKATSLAINIMQQFRISKTLSAELTGMYRSAGLYGIMRVDPFGNVGAGISHKVMKNKGTIKLSARDIFYTQRLKGLSKYSNVDVIMRQVNESQVFTIGFTYSFSKGKKIAPVKRTEGSADEEQGRIEQ